MRIHKLSVPCDYNMQVLSVIDSENTVQSNTALNASRLIEIAKEFANEPAYTKVYAMDYPLQDWEICAIILLSNGDRYGIYFKESGMGTGDENMFIMGCSQFDRVVIPTQWNGVRHRPRPITSFYLTPYDIGCLKESKGEYKLRSVLTHYNSCVIPGHEVVGMIRLPIAQV